MGIVTLTLITIFNSVKNDLSKNICVNIKGTPNYWLILILFTPQPC